MRVGILARTLHCLNEEHLADLSCCNFYTGSSVTMPSVVVALQLLKRNWCYFHTGIVLPSYRYIMYSVLL